MAAPTFRFVRAARIRVGAIRARGVPAILMGAAAVVFAAGFAEAFKRAATSLPETIREARQLLLAARSSRELTGR